MKPSNQRKKYLVLTAVILAAAFFRLYGIAYHDIYTDEAVLAFRSIGLVDFAAVRQQTTPWQWFELVPWWAHLSFHDHPLGFFLLQHISIRLLGQTLFAIRLPAVLIGIGSVYLVYLLGKKLFDERAGLVAAALLAVQSYHVWISRVGIQDGVVIFFILLALLLWLYARENSKWWVWWGLSFGFAVFIKYTALVLAPMFLWELYSRRASRRARIEEWRRFFYGVVVFCIVVSPIIIYNIFLYRAAGHFDFQLSAVLGQDAPAWQFRMGRSQVGGIGDKFINFFRAFLQANSPWFNAAAAISFILAVASSIRSRFRSAEAFVLGSTIILWLWFLVIGSTYRFVVMVVPFIVLLISRLFSHAVLNTGRTRKYIIAAATVFILAEAVFTVNSFFIHPSRGRQNVAYAQVNEETRSLGFRELDDFLSHELGSSVSGLFGQPAYSFLSDIQTRHIENAKKAGARTRQAMIVYDRDLNFMATLWTIQRHLYYEGWPVVPDNQFLEYAGSQMDRYFREQGVAEFMYVRGASEQVRDKLKRADPADDALETYILSLDEYKRTVMYDGLGREAFFVYQF